MVVVLVADHLVFHKTLLCVSSNERYKWPALSAQWVAKWLVFTRMLQYWVVRLPLVKHHIEVIRQSPPHSWKCDIGMAARARQSALTGGLSDLPMARWCLQSTSCCSSRHGGPVQSASLSRPWWCYHLWSQTRVPKTAKLSSDGRVSDHMSKPRMKECALFVIIWMSGRGPSLIRRSGTRFQSVEIVVPLLLIHHGLLWHPNNNQEWTLLHTAVPWLIEWLVSSNCTACTRRLSYKRYNKTSGPMA